MKKLLTILLSLLMVSAMYARDRIEMVVEDKTEKPKGNVYFLVGGEFDDCYDDNTEFRDMQENLGTHYHKVLPYNTDVGYYAFGHAGIKDSRSYKRAKEDYEKLQEKLKEIFPGIVTILEEGAWRDGKWAIRLNFRKDCSFSSSKGKTVPAEIITVNVYD